MQKRALRSELPDLFVEASSATPYTERVEGYSDTILDHFQRPRNQGALDGANAIAYMTNPVCGDTLLLMLHIKDGRIADARWQSDGCAASIAAASLLSELVRGMSLEEADAVTREAIVEALGGLPLSKLHASVLAADGLRHALADWRERQNPEPRT